MSAVLSRLLCLALLPTAALSTAAERGLDARDLVALDRVSSPLLSPNGSQLVYALREADVANNRATTGLYIRGLEDGARARRLNAEGKSASSPSFSPDGTSLYYLSAESGSMQVWAVALKGGAPKQVTDYPLDVGTYRLSPDGTRLALSFRVHPDCADLKCSTERSAALAAEKASGKTYDQLFVRHWDSWNDGLRNHLFVAELNRGRARGEPQRISRGIDGDVPSVPFGGSDDYAWAPDGRSLVFSVRIAGRTEPQSTNFDLFQAGITGTEAPRNLTPDNPAWDANPLFADDGKTLYYTAMARPGFEADRMAIMALDLASGERREVAPDWDFSAGALSLHQGELFTTTNRLGEHPLFAIKPDSGAARVVVGGGNVSGFALHGDTLVFQRDTLTAPAQLFTSTPAGGVERALTDFNRERLAGIGMGEFEQFSFEGHGGETVYGFAVKPVGYVEGRKYPVAFIIHGGPQGSMGNSFHYRWNPQTYAARGYGVVFIDFHGSTGYGQAFTDAISQDWGGKPLEDLQKGWAAALERYDYLDGERACALGASYGGYMVNWIAGQWGEAWDCLVSHAGVFDTRMMGYSTEELWFTEWENGGTVFENPAAYERFNPLLHVDKWQTPMLVIHGQLDYRIPVEQGIAAFTALQRRDIPSQFLYFPDENHWILKPANSIQWHDSVLAWMDRWTKE
jgi:dipeptidyl aminopeptidase/acylaminoacyl peptidase